MDEQENTSAFRYTSNLGFGIHTWTLDGITFEHRFIRIVQRTRTKRRMEDCKHVAAQ